MTSTLRIVQVSLILFVALSAQASPPAIVPFTGYVTKDVTSINLQLELVNPDNNQILWCQKTTGLAVVKRRFMLNIGLIGVNTSVCVADDYADLVGFTDEHIVNIFTLETFISGELQVRLKVDGTRILTPQALHSLPYAAVSQYAERAKNFTIEQNATVQGNLEIDQNLTIRGAINIETSDPFVHISNALKVVTKLILGSSDDGNYDFIRYDDSTAHGTSGQFHFHSDTDFDTAANGNASVYAGAFLYNGTKLNAIKVVSGSISHGENITTKIPSGFSSGWTWKWIISMRDCYGNRFNNDYEQAQDQFQYYISSNVVTARGRVYNFKHSRWGNWRNCTANYFGIGIK